MEDYGQLPVGLQQQVVQEMIQAKNRSSMRVDDSLICLGVSRANYFRWKKEQAWSQKQVIASKPVQAFEVLPEEKAAVVKYALEHPGVRHRELSWRMVDDDVAFLSSSTVYRILHEENLMCLRPGRRKSYREDVEKASRRGEIWATDLMYLNVNEIQYYLVNFIDEYSLTTFTFRSKRERHLKRHQKVSLPAETYQNMKTQKQKSVGPINTTTRPLNVC